MNLHFVLLLSLAVPAADKDAGSTGKAKPAARVAVTAELACLHCTFGEGDGCCLCLKVDDKTPIVLTGPAAKAFFEERLSDKVVVAEGSLAINKDKRLELTSDHIHFYSEKDKGKAPEKGLARVTGGCCCGQCDLQVCDECTLAVVNGATPILLHGKLAARHIDAGHSIRTTGRPFLDKLGRLRLEAKTVDLEKK